MKKSLIIFLGGLSALIAASFFILSATEAATCPLPTGRPYKSSDAKTVYFITTKCTKQIVPNPDIYLSYFKSWKNLRTTSSGKLKSLPYDKQRYLLKKKTAPISAPQVIQNTKTFSQPKNTILSGKGIGATKGPDKPQGNYTPAIYSELTLSASRNETIGFFVRADVLKCEKINFASPAGIKVKFFDLPIISTSKRSAPSLFLGRQFDPAVPKNTYSICPENGGWIFVDLFVSSSTAPGFYHIPMKLGTSGAELKLHLKVFPMVFDLKNAAMPSYWIYDEWAGVQQHLSGRWDHPDRLGLYKSYLYSMSDHKMFALNSEMAPLKIMEVNGKKELDVESNGYLEYVIKNRPDNAYISIPWNRDKSVEEQMEYLIAAQNTVVKRGWQNRAYIYLVDEPHRSKYPYLAKQAKLAKEIAPNIKVMITTVADPELVPYVDIFVVLIDQIDSSGFPSPKQYRELMDSGKQIWLYFSCDSHGCSDSKDTNWPDLMLDNPAVHARTVGWMNDHFGTNGFLYYYTNLAYYNGNPFYNQFDFGGNGDGNLFYPGKKGEYELANDQPIPSLRMKIFRESANDAEYLKMLRNSKNAPKDLINRIENLIQSSEKWSKNFQDYQQLRDDVGEFLAKQLY